MQKNYQKIYKTSIILVLVCSLLINPFIVFADSATYYEYSAGSCLILKSSSSSYYMYFNADQDMRLVRGSYGGVYLVSDKLTHYNSKSMQSSSDSCYSTTPNTLSTYSYNGLTYYGYTFGAPSSATLNIDIPYFSDITTMSRAIYYTYGDGAISPVEPVVMGDLVTGFYTQFATRGNNIDSIRAMRSNKDTITWDTVDSDGNDISGILWVVDVRAVPTVYSSTSKNSLLSQSVQDIILGTDRFDITSISASQGQFSITWGDLVDNYLQNYGILQNIFAQLNESEWIQKGWIYQVRLRSLSEDRPYEGQWQTVYNTTSSAPSDAQTIMNYYYYTNGNGLNPGVVNSIQNINTTNNTTNNWYVDDQEIDTDPDHSWIEKLIEALVSLVQSILDFFKGIFDGLVDLLLGLLDGFDPVGSFMGWWSDLLNGFNGIDLTLPEFNLPEIEGIESLSILPQKTIELFTDNGLGIVIFVPLILMILRLFL